MDLQVSHHQPTRKAAESKTARNPGRHDGSCAPAMTVRQGNSSSCSLLRSLVSMDEKSRCALLALNISAGDLLTFLGSSRACTSLRLAPGRRSAPRSCACTSDGYQGPARGQDW